MIGEVQIDKKLGL